MSKTFSLILDSSQITLTENELRELHYCLVYRQNRGPGAVLDGSGTEHLKKSLEKMIWGDDQ